VTGVLHGTPVSKSWAHRWLAPLGVTALERLTGDRLGALKLFGALMLAAANVLLFRIARRNGPTQALAAVACFGFAHALLMYKLEYPWDGIDIVLFLAFGSLVAAGGELVQASPLLLLGTFNHETILYVPLWYLLEPLERPAAPRLLRRWLTAGALLVALEGSILALRSWLYVGRPNGPGHVFEPAVPLIDNHEHVVHNLRQLLRVNWHEGRGFISIGVLLATAWFCAATRDASLRRAAVWSLIVLATIVCFGYVNETRHYLLLVAFWFAYLCASARSEAPASGDATRAGS